MKSVGDTCLRPLTRSGGLFMRLQIVAKSANVLKQALPGNPGKQGVSAACVANCERAQRNFRKRVLR